jgi:hypothetical protein
MIAVGTPGLPLPDGERMEVRGLGGCEHSPTAYPLTLPSPLGGEGESRQ